MIPKIIHFCWLSGDPYPKKIKKCMKTWKRIMPDYKIKLWNMETFDVSNAPVYVQEAIKAHKWAFAADYIRMYALYTEGGIYLDSDVKILKRFDEFLHYSFFSSLEYHPSQIERDGTMAFIDKDGKRTADVYISGIQIQAAVMGAEKGIQFLKDVLDWYQDKHFINEDGSLATDVLSPYIYARVAENYGFIYKDQDQDLNCNMKIFRSEIFAGNKHEATSASYAIHLCAHSWGDTFIQKIIKRIFKFS